MLPENNDYKYLVEEIKNKVRQAQYSAMVKVNSEMIQLYWNIGKELKFNLFADSVCKNKNDKNTERKR